MGVKIGLTGWGDHPALYTEQTRSEEKLAEYGSHFPVVEVDTAFYAIQPRERYEKWLKETPDSFSFVIKAFQQLTGHDRESRSVQEARDLMKRYEESIQPVWEKGQIDCLLFQFPPWFDVRKENIRKLRYIRDWLESYPLALEFRNRSWFQEGYKAQTLDFMRDQEWIHTICDEPQAGKVLSRECLYPPTPKNTGTLPWTKYSWMEQERPERLAKSPFLIPIQRRRAAGVGGSYNRTAEKTPEITLLFNNNSGGDAADNAKEMQDLLKIQYHDLNPRQMDLFGF